MIGKIEGEEDDRADDRHLEQNAQWPDARRRARLLPPDLWHRVVLGSAAVEGQHEEGAEHPQQEIDGERRRPFHRPILRIRYRRSARRRSASCRSIRLRRAARSEEHTSELQSLMRISYAVFCLKKKNINT